MGELICKKHKKEQKRVPTNFIFDQMFTYRDPEDNRLRMAISIFQNRTKETRFNITIRCLRLREEKEDGSAVLEWDGGNILVPYCSVEKEIVPHSMDGRGYYVVDVETPAMPAIWLCGTPPRQWILGQRHQASLGAAQGHLDRRSGIHADGPQSA